MVNNRFLVSQSVYNTGGETTIVLGLQQLWSDTKSTRKQFLSRVSILTRDSDIAILSVPPSVRLSVCPSRSGIR